MGDRGDRGDRGRVRRRPAPDRRCRGGRGVLAHARAGRGVRPRSRHRRAARLLRGVGRRCRRRRGLRGHPPRPARAPTRASTSRRRQARAVREAVRGRSAAGRRRMVATPAPTGCSSWRRSGAASCPPTSSSSAARQRTHRRAAPRRGRLRVRRTVRSDPPPLRPRARRRGHARPRHLPRPARGHGARPARPAAGRRHIGETGVDEQVAAVLHHPGGRLAWSRRPSASGGVHGPHHGHRGLDRASRRSCTARTTDRGTRAGATERIDAPLEGEGLRFQVDRGPPLHRRGTDREPDDAPRRELRHRRHARRAPGPGRLIETLRSVMRFRGFGSIRSRAAWPGPPTSTISAASPAGACPAASSTTSTAAPRTSTRMAANAAGVPPDRASARGCSATWARSTRPPPCSAGRCRCPLVLAPTGFTRIADPEGELAVARAARRGRAARTRCSTLGTRSIEEVAAVSDGRKWFQVYVLRDRGLVKEMVDRAAGAGFEALVLTVDTAVLGRRERDVRRGFELPPEDRARHAARRRRPPGVDVALRALRADPLRQRRRSERSGDGADRGRRSPTTSTAQYRPGAHVGATSSGCARSGTAPS